MIRLKVGKDVAEKGSGFEKWKGADPVFVGKVQAAEDYVRLMAGYLPDQEFDPIRAIALELRGTLTGVPVPDISSGQDRVY